MRLEVLWRQLAGTGEEHLILDEQGGVHADSLSVGEINSTAYRIHYGIDCDSAWNVQRLRAEDLLSGAVLNLTRDGEDQWTGAADRQVEALRGCRDVDIMITPFTNTLPIRRLGLKVGEAREIAVVYVALPGLLTSRVEQRYTCLSQGEDGGLYRYENLRSGFTANLKVDMDGLVVDYPDIFKMEAKRRL